MSTTRTQFRRIINLGPAFAGNQVNTVIYRTHGLVTRGHYQFTAYYESLRRIVVVRRDLRDDSLQRGVIDGDYQANDAHNMISLGIDAAGYVHASYNHHSYPGHWMPLTYRRSLKPLDISSWSPLLAMTGTHEDRVTYPVFIMLPRDAGDREGCGEMLFMYRDGSAGNGDLIIKAYDAVTQQWSDRAVPAIKGSQQQPWPVNPYWNTPVVNTSGHIHLTWTWRFNPGPMDWYNHNISHARSEDAGRTWLTTQGKPLRLPMTPATAETIHCVPPMSNLINTCDSAVDSRGRPHVVFYANDDKGVPQFQHLWHDNGRWRCDVISRRTQPFQLIGGGSLNLPISRPCIVLDEHDRAFVLYRGDITNQRLVAQRLDPPDYQPLREPVVLQDEPVGETEPVFDRIRWQRDRVLSLLVQKTNYHPDNSSYEHESEPICIVDVSLND